MEKKRGVGRQMHNAPWTPVSLQYVSELGLGPPEALNPRNEESSAEDKPFPPRFLQQAIIFAHSPYGGLFPNSCLPSLPCVPTAQSRGALLGAMPVLLDDSRWRPDQVPWSGS